MYANGAEITHSIILSADKMIEYQTHRPSEVPHELAASSRFENFFRIAIVCQAPPARLDTRLALFIFANKFRQLFLLFVLVIFAIDYNVQMYVLQSRVQWREQHDGM